MLSNIQRTIIIRAIRIRQEGGEDPAKIMAGYKNLTEDEKTGILEEVEKEG